MDFILILPYSIQILITDFLIESSHYSLLNEIYSILSLLAQIPSSERV